MAYTNSDTISQQLQDLSRQLQQSYNFQYPQAAPQVQQIPIPIPSRQVQYVEGLAGAKLYQQNLPSNSSEIIMDKNESIFYKVSKDANGTPSKTIPRGHFTLDDMDEEPTYITRKDLDDFKDEMRSMLLELKTPKTTTTSTPKVTK